MNKDIKSALFGVAIADALGVPVEFKGRSELEKNRVTDMIGFGTYNQPPGTWSDDSSLTFCLADSLCSGYNLIDIAKKFVSWKQNAIWTPFNEVFDIGITTSESIDLLENILRQKNYQKLYELINSSNERTNGNGSLMRIIPLLFHIKDMPIEQQFGIVKEVSALTHGHIRAAISCQIYLTFAKHLLIKEDKFVGYLKTQDEIISLMNSEKILLKEQKCFFRILENDISKYNIKDIESSGYVIHSLEAAFWCFLNNSNYESSVLSAVNLGYDTDTTAAITGGISGIYYGFDSFPKHWINTLAKSSKIMELAEKLSEKYP